MSPWIIRPFVAVGIVNCVALTLSAVRDLREARRDR